MAVVVNLGIVVEGYGDVEAVPVLVRRIAARQAPGVAVRVPRPVRFTKTRLVHRPGELERAVMLARIQAGDRARVLVVIDADDDCPAELAPVLLDRARGALGEEIPVAVVLAKREFESWFLAALESLRGHRGLRDDAKPPQDPEAIRGAKEWLAARMVRSYRETVDQAALAAGIDLDRARQRSPSFAKLVRDLERLLQAQVAGAPGGSTRTGIVPSLFDAPGKGGDRAETDGPGQPSQECPSRVGESVQDETGVDRAGRGRTHIPPTVGTRFTDDP